MRHLLRSNYVPYGSQYYRAPSPRPEDWETDLSRMADLGFNMVKYWVQWRWNHPEEGRFYFDDIDRLMELSERIGLKVMLNTIVDVAPAWIYRKYPDASMLTLDGRRIGPQTQPHRQIGGLGLCLNHPDAVEPMFDFIRATVERYGEHPALEIWNVGSEPELTQSMSEMRRYAADASRMGDMLCYCDHCRQAFHKWLATRYESIDQLNLAWNRNYTSFEDAELPKTRNTFNDLVDWRMFFVHTLGENVRRRFEVAAEENQGRRPLMCHHVFIQGFPITSTANDPWNVGRYGDLHGFTQMDDAMMHDILRSCARGKPVMSAEMLMLMGYTLNLPRTISSDDIKRHIFTGIAANLKGFLFWQYRPETLGREAPTWGLAHLDGSSTPWLESFAEIGRALQQHTDLILGGKPPDAEVAILYHPENEIFAWASTGSEQTATDSLLGAHRALYDANISVDFLHPRDLVDLELLGRYRVILVSFPYWLDEDTCIALEGWVHDGGTLIGEAYFAGWHMAEGRHQTTVPGYGLHEVFGVRQWNAEPASEGAFRLVHGLLRPHASPMPTGVSVSEPAPGEGFLASIPVDASDGAGQAEILLERDLPGIPAGTKIYGAMVKEVFTVEGADVIGRYRDGSAAIVSHNYGSGRAILVGSYVALAAHRSGRLSGARLLAGLVRQDERLSMPHVSDGLRVRCDRLTGPGGEVLLIVQNNEGRSLECSIRVPDALPPRLTEVFTGDELVPVPSGEASILTISLETGAVRVFHG